MSAAEARDTPALTTTPAVRLGLNLKKAQHLLRLRIDAQLKPLSLNAGLWAVLHELAKAPGASSSELARAAFQTPQAVGGLIQKLTELGMVERRQPRGRVVENNLTSRGRTVYQQATQQMDTLMGAVLAGLTPADRDTIAALLGTVISTLGGLPEAAELRRPGGALIMARASRSRTADNEPVLFWRHFPAPIPGSFKPWE